MVSDRPSPLRTTTRSLRFLIQHHHSRDEINGVMTYVQLLDRELQARGIETNVISTKEAGIQQWLDAIWWADVVHMNSNHLGFAVLSKLLIKKIIIKYHYLLYQSTHWHYESMDFWQRLRVEYHAAFPPKTAPLKWQLFVFVKFARLAIRLGTAGLADRHTACSNFLGESCAFSTPVVTVYNPIDVAIALPPKGVGDLEHPHTFVFAGRVVKDKGPAVLLEAARILAAKGRSFRVVVVGDGGGRPGLEALTLEWGLSDRVEFLGWQPRETVVTLMERAIATVVPSQWQEPASYVVMESASRQTCPIVSHVGGMLEMAGPDGLVFPATDVAALAELMDGCLQDPEGAIARGRAAWHYTASQFSSDRAADTLLNVCRPLLSERLAATLPIANDAG